MKNKSPWKIKVLSFQLNNTIIITRTQLLDISQDQRWQIAGISHRTKKCQSIFRAKNPDLRSRKNPILLPHLLKMLEDIWFLIFLYQFCRNLLIVKGSKFDQLSRLFLVCSYLIFSQISTSSNDEIIRLPVSEILLECLLLGKSIVSYID